MSVFWGVSSATAAVSKFNSRTGDVVPVSGDYDETMVSRKYTTFSNAPKTIDKADREVMQVGTLSAARTATLPAAADVAAGAIIAVGDASGTVTETNTIIVAKAGADTINGAETSDTIYEPFGIHYYMSDGASNWTVSLENEGTFEVVKAVGSTDSTSTTTGSGIFSGGLGVLKALWVGGLANIAGVLTAANTTDSTSSTTGGTKISGGLGIVKALWVGGLANIAGVVTHASTTDSTSPTTGGNIFSGGLGLAKALWVGGLANIAGVFTAANVTDATSSTAAGTIVSGGLAVAKKANIGTNLDVGGPAAVADATDSTSTTTGSVKTAGGIAAVKALWIGGLANIAGVLTAANTTDATTTTAAGTVVTGGLGVAKAFFLGGGANLASYLKVKVQSVVSAAGSTAVASTTVLANVTGTLVHGLTLPESATSGQRVIIIKNSSTLSITVTPDATDTIDGVNAAITLPTLQSATLILNGTDWTKN